MPRIHPFIFIYLFQFMATNTTNKKSNNNNINKNRESHWSCAKEPETPYKAKKKQTGSITQFESTDTILRCDHSKVNIYQLYFIWFC